MAYCNLYMYTLSNQDFFIIVHMSGQMKLFYQPGGPEIARGFPYTIKSINCVHGLVCQ